MRLPSRKSCASFLLYTAFAAVALLLGYGLFFLLFRLLLPFTLAWALAFLLQPTVRFVHRRTGFSRRRVGTAVALLFFALLGTLIGFLIYRLFSELFGLFAALEQNREALLERIFTELSHLVRKIPFLGARLGNDQNALRAQIWSALTQWGSQSGARLPALLERGMRSLPASIIAFFVFLLASVYLCADFTEVNAFFLARLPQSAQTRVHAAKREFLRYLLRYLRAYLYLLFLTFSELLIGFMLLRVPYAFGLAFLIACLDILPILGVGTVLIPLALLALLFGNYYLGTGLLILFAIITLVRQVAEPRILGAQMGLHPLPTLLATYVGYRLFGFFGLIGAPILFSSLAKAKRAVPREKPDGTAQKQTG